MFDNPESADDSPLVGGVPAKTHRQDGLPCVIYEFSLGGWVYVGRHYLKPGHGLADWPESGTGPLPDGYEGSGIQPWGPIKAKYGIENASWVILDRFEGVPHSVVREAEEDAISAAKAIFGRQCANKADADGWTPEEARALAERRNTAPEYAEFRAKNAAHLERLWADPVQQARNAAHLTRLNADPAQQAQTAALWADEAFRERHAEAVRAKWQDEAFRHRNAEAVRTNWQDQAFRQRNAEAVRIGKRASAPITASTNIVTVLKTDPKGSEINGRKIFAHCRTGMAISEVRAACEAAGLSGPRYASDKTDQFVSSGLRQLARSGVIRIDTPEDFEVDHRHGPLMAAE